MPLNGPKMNEYYTEIRICYRFTWIPIQSCHRECIMHVCVSVCVVYASLSAE